MPYSALPYMGFSGVREVLTTPAFILNHSSLLKTHQSSQVAALVDPYVYLVSESS
jgi:hypothetical protein